MMHALAAMSLADILHHSGLVAKSVLVILLLFSLISWSIMIDRWLNYSRLLSRARDFYEQLRSATRVTDIVTVSRATKDNPLKEMFLETYKELHDQVKDQMTPDATMNTATGEIKAQIRHSANLERTMQRVMRDQTIHLESGLAFLATTAAATPFIGLFGTVWGIMEAFRAIGMSGSATLASVAPGISEALITTAGGLFAAIPALVGYNLLGRKVKTFHAYMEQFGLDLLNFLENRFG
ncbi:MAG: MotA/TolQ/ExbB proton channel family protein [Acidobacteriota bacterium]|jgi:biopolymer transport protein TolQ